MQEDNLKDEGAKSNIANHPVSSRFICEHCEEEWEIEFKCKQCSDKMITEFVEKPNLHWSGAPGDDEMELGEEDVYTGNVCGNCCRCHENGC